MNKIMVITVAVVMAAAVGALLFYRAKRKSCKGAMTETTFAIIKPDAVAAKNSGKIIDLIEKNGFTILRLEKTQISKDKAREFYAVHKDKPFFNELVDFISSGPVVIMALEKEQGIKAWRDLMGATDPKKADEGTVRKLFGTSIGNNATHGSDAPETAATELALFFPDLKNCA
jgi:nucleoside-diphosphate kinase